MTLQDYGNIGELISGIAVIFSPIYVAFQIRPNTRQVDQNTQAVQAAGMDAAVGSTMNAGQTVYESAEMSAISLR